MAPKAPTPITAPTAIDLSVLAEAIKTAGFAPVHQDYFLSRLNAVGDEYQRITERRAAKQGAATTTSQPADTEGQPA